jgi:nitric oxide reductase NorQ protein
MAHRIYRQGGNSIKQPLQTVACHEDLSATDLVGRFLLKAEETVWQDGLYPEQ